MESSSGDKLVSFRNGDEGAFRYYYDLYYNAGRQQILSNPRVYGEIVYRPVDRRENYVKRCVGCPEIRCRS